MITNFKIFDNYNDKVTSSYLIPGRMYMSDYWEDNRILFFIDHTGMGKNAQYSDLFYIIWKEDILMKF